MQVQPGAPCAEPDEKGMNSARGRELHLGMNIQCFVIPDQEERLIQ